jgi:transcriptional regulator with XRE-family HTH domain
MLVAGNKLQLEEFYMEDMDEMEILIGKRIREQRKSHKMTLQDLATKVGISKAMLSKIELGKVSTPISTYSRIAKNLEMSLVALIGETKTGFLLIRKEDKKPISSSKTSKGYRYEMLGNTWPNKTWSAYLITYSAETAKEKPNYIHDSCEFAYVLEGQMQFRYEDQTFLLSEGDCIFFDGSRLHGGKAYGGKPCKTLLILTPKS